MTRISVDPDEMTTLATSCELDSGEIMGLATNLGAHVGGAGLNLLLAYGIGITTVVDQLAHIAGSPDGVLRVAHRFSVNAQSVTRTLNAFLAADGQPIPTSPHRWSPWDLLDPLKDVTEGLKAFNTLARTMVAGEHTLEAGLGLVLTITSSLAGSALGEAGKALAFAEKQGKNVLDFGGRELEKDLVTAEQRFAQKGADVMQYGRQLLHLGEDVGDELGHKIVDIGAERLAEGERLVAKAKLLGKLKVFDKYLGPIGVLVDTGFVAKDVLAPKDGKIDDWDVTLDTAQVIADVAMLSDFPPAQAVGLGATVVIAGAKYYKEHTQQVNNAIGKVVDLEANFPGLFPLAPLAKFYKDHPEINQPVNRVIKAVGNEAAHVVAGKIVNEVQGAADIVSGQVGELHGLYDVVAGDPVKGGKEIISGGVKTAKGMIKSLMP